LIQELIRVVIRENNTGMQTH